MEFTNLVDLVQVFANEYCQPNFMVLINLNETTKIFKNLFKFINAEVIVIGEVRDVDVDIIVTGIFLPFESNSFDLIISFKNEMIEELKRVLKPNGKLLIKNGQWEVL